MKFKMNRSEYEIKEVKQEELMKYKNQDEGYYYGQSHFIEHEIWIDEELPFERKKRTLYHELMHVYIREYLTTRDIEPNEEVMCDISANSHEIIHEIVEEYFNRLTIEIDNNVPIKLLTEYKHNDIM